MRTVEDEIVVVLGKLRGRKAAYFDEVKAIALAHQESLLRRAGDDPARLDPRSGKSLAETRAITQLMSATGADRTLARQWWECRQEPEPAARWLVIEHLPVSPVQRRRLHDAAGVLRRREIVAAEPGPSSVPLAVEAGENAFWSGLRQVVRVTHETHNFTVDPGVRQPARDQAIAAATLLTTTMDQGQTVALSAKADAFTRLRELQTHPRDRRDAAIEAEAVARRVYTVTGDATQLVEALRVWALELRDRRPERAAEELAKMAALRAEARVPDHFWAAAELDAIGVDLVLRRDYWSDRVAQVAGALRRLEERLNGLDLAWTALMSRRRLAQFLAQTGAVDDAVADLDEALIEYQEAAGVGAYHIALIEEARRDITRGATPRAS